MKFHNMGKYNGDEDSLPQRNHHENAVAFKEAQDMKKLSIVVNFGAFILIFILAIPFYILGFKYFGDNLIHLFIGLILPNFMLIPHEFLHAICFIEDVYMYSNLSQGLMFVIGVEDMNKSRFIFMSLLPNIIFGFIPFIIFLLNPSLVGFGLFGLLSIGMGFGDYYNVYNAITQMPKGAKTYMSGMHSYWYLP